MAEAEHPFSKLLKTITRENPIPGKKRQIPANTTAKAVRDRLRLRSWKTFRPMINLNRSLAADPDGLENHLDFV